MNRRVLVGLGISLVILGTCATRSEAGTATVYGRVTEPDGITPAANTTVTIGVAGGMPWVRHSVSTNVNGDYTVSMPFPDIVEIAFFAEAVKTMPLPFKEGYARVQFLEVPPNDGGSYRLDIKLYTISPYGASIRGMLTDAESGQPIANHMGLIYVYGGSVTNFWTNSKGSYQEFVDLQSSTAKVSISIGAAMGSTGAIKYALQEKNLLARAGRFYTVNLTPTRDRDAAYLFGTITDASNAQPIPFALVTISDGFCYGRHVDSTTTDVFGRYIQWVPGGRGYAVSTTGAHTLVDRRSRFFTSCKPISVRPQEAVSLDLQLKPK